MFWGLFFRYKTWKDRVEIYKLALAELERKPDVMCIIFNKVEPRFGGWIGQLWRLPEIYWYKPFLAGKWDPWWPLDDEGIARRKAILIMAIEDFDKSRKIEQDYDPYYDDRD